MGSATVTTLPRHARLLIFSVMVTGLAAASVTESAYLALATPAMALLIVLASRTKVVPDPDGYASPLPLPLQRAVEIALANLDATGDAQRLLRGVVRQAEPQFARHDSAFDAEHEALTRANTTELVLECCEVALQLGQVDELRSGEISASRDAAAREQIRDKYHPTRDLLVQQLTNAANALSALYVSGVEHGTPATDRLSELVTEIRQDAQARSAAAQEMHG